MTTERVPPPKTMVADVITALARLGRKSLHVTPQQFAALEIAIADGEAKAFANPDEVAAAALEAIGVTKQDVDAARGLGFDVVVDYALEGPPRVR